MMFSLLLNKNSSIFLQHAVFLLALSNNSNNKYNYIIHRRDCLSSLILLQQSFPLAFPKSTFAFETNDDALVVSARGQDDTILQTPEDHHQDSSTLITLPLERCSGGTNCIRVAISYDPIVSRFDASLLYVPTKVFKLAVDTGSPYLVISDGFEFASYVEEEVFTTTRDDHDEKYQYSNRNNEHTENNNNNNLAFSSMMMKQLAFLFEPEMKFGLKQDSGYSPTIDVYGSQSGTITWKKSKVRTTSSIDQAEKVGRPYSLLTNLVFGILDENLAQESGGPLFGLIKHCNLDPTSSTQQDKVQIRPTLLQQLSISDDDGGDGGSGGGTISSFAIDSPNRLLTLSTKSLLAANNVSNNEIMPLVDLRLYGDFVDHYAVPVLSLDFGNGKVITPHDIVTKRINGGTKTTTTTTTTTTQERPIVAVLDTGLTGCLMSDDLWKVLFENEVDEGEEQQKVDSLSVTVKTVMMMSSNHHNNNNDSSTWSSSFVFHAKFSPSENPFFSLGPISLDWFDDEDTCPFVIVLGQTFLNQGKLTIDIEDRRAHFSI